MLIKEQKVENCECCGRFVKEISPEQHGCDQCEKPIVPYGNDERLDVRVFSNKRDSSSKAYFFCSWKCVFKFVKKVKTDYFFTLPYIIFDNKVKGRRVKDFFAAIKAIR